MSNLFGDSRDQKGEGLGIKGATEIGIIGMGIECVALSKVLNPILRYNSGHTNLKAQGLRAQMSHGILSQVRNKVPWEKETETVSNYLPRWQKVEKMEIFGIIFQ